MKSTDAGDTWIINTQAGNSEPFFGSGGTLDLVTAWFFDANTGFVGGSNSDTTGNSYIQRTTNGGQTFTRIPLNNGSGAASIRDIFFLNASTGYICGNQNLRLMKTTNGGLNWINVQNLPIEPNSFKSIYATDENNIFIGTDYNGTSGKILKTTNGGLTWNTDILPGTTGFTVNDILFKDSNTGYVAAGNSYFAFTTNAGISWTQAVFPISSRQLYTLKIIGSNVYVLGSYESYYYTSNLGVSWDSVKFTDPSNLNQPYTSAVYSFDINGPDQIIVGLYGKVNVSNDGGSTWRNKNYSVGNNDDTYPCIFALKGTNDVWAGSEFTGKVLHSTNSGANWTIQQTTMNTIINDLIMVTPQVGYFTGGNVFNGQGGKTFRTINGGANWVQLSLPNSYQPLFDIDFVDIYTGWVWRSVSGRCNNFQNNQCRSNLG
ncbi:MAG: YCF48-related protein [Ignavibacteria bacterium]